MTETSLFLSPHLDDAVLSCPGSILRDVKRGRRVVVASLFTDGGAAEDARRLYEVRREEDLGATRALGAEAQWSGLPDAPFRHAFYDSFRAIVLETHADDASYAEEIAVAIRDLCARLQPTAVYAPLGVGTHIDHRLSHAAVASLAGAGALPGDAVSYYEDRPYAFIREQVRMRLAELGIAPAGEQPPVDLAPLSARELAESFLTSFDAAGYVKAYLPEGGERASCRRRLLETLTRSGRASRSLEPRLLTLEERDFERCIEAVAAYRSQLADLFGSIAGYVKAARDYTRRLGARAAYAERSWSA